MPTTRTLTRLAAAATTAAALLVAGAPSAGADTPWSPPTHALPDTDIAVSGTGCTTGTTPPKVYVYLNPGSVEDIGSSTSVTIATDVSGNWSGTLHVPSTFAPGAYTLWAQCVVSFNYDAIPFTVDDPDATTTTTTTTTTLAPTTTAAPTTTTGASTLPGSSTTSAGSTTTIAAAQPATAVAAQPTFTG